MKEYRTILLFMAAMVAGTAAGIIDFVVRIVPQQYVSQKLFGLSARYLQESLNTGVLLSVGAAFLIWVFMRYAGGPAANLGKTFEKGVRPGGVRFDLAIRITACLGCFLLSGWLLSRYSIRLHRFASVLCCFGLFLPAVVLVSWMRRKRCEEPSGISIRTRLWGCAALLLLLSVNLAVFAYGRIRPPTGPNIILVGIDTLRADHLRCYGYPAETSPVIDEAAEKAVVFKNAVASSSWTLPSFHSIFTSLYQSSHGVVTDGYRLNDSFVTLAEVLRNSGYRTAGFIAGPYLKSGFGFNQGYDLYDESASSSDNFESHRDVSSPEITELAVSWLRKNKESRFFLFLHYWDPHYDYVPPAPYDTMFDPKYRGTTDGTQIEAKGELNFPMRKRDLRHIKALYDGEIRWTDLNLGKLFDQLKKWSLYDDTVVIITGDHGEEFRERGRIGHRFTLYNEVIHVPLIIAAPGIEERRDVETRVSLVDIMPTVLDMVGIPHEGETDGRSLVSMMTGAEGGERAIFSELDVPLAAMFKGKWKVIYSEENDAFALFDQENDPRETRDMADLYKDMTGDLIGELHSWRKMKKKAGVTAKASEIDRETIEQLKALGYTQ